MIKKEDKILIVGLGLIGGSYAMGLTKRGYQVYAIDINPEAIKYAKEHQIITDGASYADEALIQNADLIILSIYPSKIVEWVKTYQHLFKKNIVMTDVSGVKCSFIYELAKVLRPDISFVGAHPMAGREVYGVQNADDTIFKGANYLVTPLVDSSIEAIETVKSIGEILEFKYIEVLTPEEHDEMIGFLSQLTHVIAISLMTGKECTHFVKYTGDSFRDLTRIARINEKMWSELFLENKQVLINEINLFETQMEKVKQALVDNDEESLQEIMKLSTERRSYFDR